MGHYDCCNRCNAFITAGECFCGFHGQEKMSDKERKRVAWLHTEISKLKNEATALNNSKSDVMAVCTQLQQQIHKLKILNESLLDTINFQQSLVTLDKQ